MIIKSIIGAACTCLTVVILDANAAMINNGSFTTDSVSGLDWLDLSITANQSYNSIESLNPGWRVATNSEVENLFAVMFDGYYDTHSDGYSQNIAGFSDSYSNQFTDVSFFQYLFGPSGTYTNDFGSFPGFWNYDLYSYAYGSYLDEDGVLRFMGTTNNNLYIGETIEYISSVVYGTEFITELDADTPYLNTGTYLVRTSTVPVPAAIWLFGAGLIGLAGVASRKATG